MKRSAAPSEFQQKRAKVSTFDFCALPFDLKYSVCDTLGNDLPTLLNLSRTCHGMRCIFGVPEFLGLIVKAGLNLHSATMPSKLIASTHYIITSYLKESTLAMVAQPVTPQLLVTFSALIHACVNASGDRMPHTLFSDDFSFRMLKMCKLSTQWHWIECNGNFAAFLVHNAPLDFLRTFLEYVARSHGIPMKGRLCLTPALMLGMMPSERWDALNFFTPTARFQQFENFNYNVEVALMMTPWQQSVELGLDILRYTRDAPLLFSDLFPCFAHCSPQFIESCDAEDDRDASMTPMVMAAAHGNIPALEVAIKIFKQHWDGDSCDLETVFFASFGTNTTKLCLKMLCAEFDVGCISFNKDWIHTHFIEKRAITARMFGFLRHLISNNAVKWAFFRTSDQNTDKIWEDILKKLEDDDLPKLIDCFDCLDEISHGHDKRIKDDCPILQIALRVCSEKLVGCVARLLRSHINNRRVDWGNLVRCMVQGDGGVEKLRSLLWNHHYLDSFKQWVAAETKKGSAFVSVLLNTLFSWDIIIQSGNTAFFELLCDADIVTREVMMGPIIDPFKDSIVYEMPITLAISSTNRSVFNAAIRRGILNVSYLVIATKQALFRLVCTCDEEKMVNVIVNVPVHTSMAMEEEGLWTHLIPCVRNEIFFTSLAPLLTPAALAAGRNVLSSAMDFCRDNATAMAFITSTLVNK